MKLARCLLALLLVASSAALTACTASMPGAATGTITLDLVGRAPSGTAYRLRDATITVDGPGPVKVWNTEDAPDQTSLSADVATGDYTALLADGWRLERIDGASATPVVAALVSDNPVQFTVVAHQRTGVPLRFQVEDGEVDMTQGYDITISVDEPPRPMMVVANGGNPNSNPRRPPSITMYATGGAGDISPLRTITGPHTGLVTGIDLAVVGDRIIVCDSNAVHTFALSASGDVAPIARITGPDTGLGSVQGIAVSNDEIYVVQARGTISVFPLTASGNVTPTRTITGTGIFNPRHMVIDHGEIFVSDSNPLVEAHVKVFPVSASGDTEPTRTMRWVPLPNTTALGIAVRGSEVFVTTESTIDVLPVDGDGVIAPLRSMSPISGGFQLTVFQDELYVASWSLDSVQVFSPDGRGTVAPIRTISGPSTQLDAPLAVFLH